MSLGERLPEALDDSAGPDPYPAPLPALGSRRHDPERGRLTQVLGRGPHAEVLPEMLLLFMIPADPTPRIPVFNSARCHVFDHRRAVSTANESKLRRDPFRRTGG